MLSSICNSTEGSTNVSCLLDTFHVQCPEESWKYANPVILRMRLDLFGCRARLSRWEALFCGSYTSFVFEKLLLE